MIDKAQTSRHWILDWLESISNLIAYTSHLQEIANSYWLNDEVTEDDYNFAMEYIDKSIQLRRDMMSMIKNEFDTNHIYRCAVKHAIAIRWTATEVSYTDIENAKYLDIQQSATEILYVTLSKWLNQEVVTCWRCMEDMLAKT